MKRILLSLFVLVAAGSQSGLAADSGLKRSSAVASDDLVLLELFYENSNKCRMREDKDGPLTIEEAELACERREALRRVIVDKRYCWDRSEVEWVKCRDLPMSEIIEQRSTGPRPPEWWHGEFIIEAYKAGGCKDSDAAVTYTDTRVEYWEQSCAVIGIMELPDIRGVVLDMRCVGEGEPEFDTQEILISHAAVPADMVEVGMTRHPRTRSLARCGAD